MTTRVIYSEHARQSLREVTLYVAKHNPGAALRLVNEIQQRLDSVLTIFPEAGPRAGDGRRFLTIRRHSVLYRYDAARDEVVILNVFGPGMDWR